MKGTVFAKNQSLASVTHLNVIFFAEMLNARRGHRKLSFFFSKFSLLSEYLVAL